MRRAVFLDRDGVVNAMVRRGSGIDSPQHPSEFQVLPRVAEAIRALNRLRLPVVVVSNQPGIAKGTSTSEFLEQSTVALREHLQAADASLDGIYYCLHHPDAVVPEYRVICQCRKPRPGLLLQAAMELDLCPSESYMVGDHPRDMLAGREAGCRTILIDIPATAAHGIGPSLGMPEVDFRCGSLWEAARWIVEAESAMTRSA